MTIHLTDSPETILLVARTLTLAGHEAFVTKKQNALFGAILSMIAYFKG